MKKPRSEIGSLDIKSILVTLNEHKIPLVLVLKTFFVLFFVCVFVCLFVCLFFSFYGKRFSLKTESKIEL